MVLTQEENDFLTQVGPGTPAGEWLRRFWQPIAPACEISDENPTRFVRVLGEDLVLFQDKSGKVGLIQDHCPHRGASLLYGRVEERGIACAYHGWLYDTEGNCLETPAEPTDSKFYLTVKAKTYPVQRFIGLYWAYLGPEPAPVIPRYKEWVHTDRKIRITVYPQLDCNWLAAVENALDCAHLQVLHQDNPNKPMVPLNTTRGATDEVDYFDFYETPWGIMKKRVYTDGIVDEHAFTWPTYLTTSWLRTPIDDEHTMHLTVGSRPSPSPSAAGEGRGEGASTPPEVRVVEMEDAVVHYLPSYKYPPDQQHPEARFHFYTPFGQPLSQDHVMWETQGAISDRTQERLAYTDRGIVMLRDLLRENIAKVMEGLDPTGVVRDEQVIDTTLGKARDRGGVEGPKREMAPVALVPREQVIPKGRLVWPPK